MPLASGTRLGPYEIVGALGSGGMGEVYRAHDRRLERDVAVKVISAELARGARTATETLHGEAWKIWNESGLLPAGSVV